MYFISVDDYRKFVFENSSARRIPPAVAGRIRKFPPPLSRIQSDCRICWIPHSYTLKKIDNMLYLQANEKRVGIDFLLELAVLAYL